MTSFKISSSDTNVSFSVSSENLMKVAPIGSYRQQIETSTTVDVSVPSSAESVNVAIKPRQIARDERQQRLNNAIRKGFALTRSTK